MSTSPIDIQLLEKSFETIQSHSDEFAVSFYHHLFEDYPDVRSLFTTTNMIEQQKKLIKSLDIILKSIGDKNTLQHMLSTLGNQHQSYGVHAEHYPIVGQTLIKTMKEFFGPKWSIEIEEAWTKAYDMIASTMLAA